MKIKNIVLSILGFLAPVIGAFLGALGGSADGDKSFRRVLIPLMLVGMSFLKTESILVLTICSMIGVLSIGYGIPDALDSGSALGRFFYNFFHSYHAPYEAYVLANIFTRGLIGALIVLSLISIPTIRQNWGIYIVFGFLIVLTNAFVSWNNFYGDWGSYVLLNKTLSWTETVTWGLITLFSTLIILL